MACLGKHLGLAKMAESIRNQQGVRIAETFVEGGKIWIRNTQQVRLGYYDPSKNETRDKNQRRIGSGNQLMSLI